MKAILTIPEREITFEYDNLTLDIFTPVDEEVDPFSMFRMSKPGGPPITLITNNMPQSLKDEISSIISKHCNH